jgi:hypothetical protein
MGRDGGEFRAQRGNEMASRFAPSHIAGAAHRPLEFPMHRRRFLATAASTVAALASLTLPRELHAGARAAAVKHPDPRPGITGDAVLPDDQVAEKAKKAYDAAREFPAILDGLYCHCECGERDGMRSLLSCFESKMPQSCGICRGEAELAGRLAREEKTLEEIRVAVDKRYS